MKMMLRNNRLLRYSILINVAVTLYICSHVIIGYESGLDLESRLKAVVKCHDHDFKSETRQRGDFWVLNNYIRAAHGELRCLESITYTTHADYTYLDNIIPLLERWNAPISIAMHAPGTDFIPTINSIKYLRDCSPEGKLVKQFATFHIYFSNKHIPKSIFPPDQVLQTPYNCSLPPPYANITSAQLYKTQKKILYPMNVGRNIARDAALTHFILASDIELYPNPGLVHKFLEMIARNDAPLQRKNPRVYPLSIFEVVKNSVVPKNKTELQELLRTNKAIQFHKRVCPGCHAVPKSKEWMAMNETEGPSVMTASLAELILNGFQRFFQLIVSVLSLIGQVLVVAFSMLLSCLLALTYVIAILLICSLILQLLFLLQPRNPSVRTIS